MVVIYVSDLISMGYGINVEGNLSQSAPGVCLLDTAQAPSAFFRVFDRSPDNFTACFPRRIAPVMNNDRVRGIKRMR
jgi:hypothetical protein